MTMPDTSPQNVERVVARLLVLDYPQSVLGEEAAALLRSQAAEIVQLKAENSKLRSALEIVHFKREPWQ